VSGGRRRAHGTQLLPPHPLGLFSAMTPSPPAQPRRSTRLAKLQVTAAAKQKLTDGWAALPPELLAKVFEALLAVSQEVRSPSLSVCVFFVPVLMSSTYVYPSTHANERPAPPCTPNLRGTTSGSYL